MELSLREAPAEAEGEEEDEEVSTAAVEDSDLSPVRMRPCSTMSSSVLVRLDQHSRAAAMADYDLVAPKC